MIYIILSVVTLWFTSLCTTTCTVKPYINYRSQSENAPRELIAIVPYINQVNPCFYSVFTSTLEYSLTWSQDRIANYLFGNSLRSETLSAFDITGSGVSDRNKVKDWLADYAGLPRDFNSTVKFRPNILNSLIDFYYYCGLNNIINGLYAYVHAPIVYTKWDLDYFESINKQGVANHPPGYFNDTVTADNIGVNRTNLLRSFTDFVFNEQTPYLGETVTFSPLTTAQMVPTNYHCHKSKLGLSDIQAVVGWNFVLEPLYHVGVGIRAVIPTGTRPDGTFLFAPTIGNGKHVELGLQLWSHYTWYVAENEEKRWLWYNMINLTHPFKAKQCRVFDLKCKPNSRYMLAERMSSNVTYLQANELFNDINPVHLVTPLAQFDALFTSVANLTNTAIHVDSAVQLDAVFMLSYISHHLEVDFGYNLWYQSREHITKACSNSLLTQHQWALKGDAYVYGFTSDFNPMVTEDLPIALSATESKATIHGGTNNFTSLDGDMGGIDGVRPTRNPGVDNPLFTVATIAANSTTVNDRTSFGLNPEQIHTSYNPILITKDLIDYAGAETVGLSNKLFVYMNYMWNDVTDNDPIGFIGAGIEVEVASHLYPITQCGIWLKGGVYFE